VSETLLRPTFMGIHSITDLIAFCSPRLGYGKCNGCWAMSYFLISPRTESEPTSVSGKRTRLRGGP